MEIGDTVFVEKASVNSMVYYSEHKKEFKCPCQWHNLRGVITRFHGNYAHVHELGNPENKSAFFLRDLTPIKSEAET